MNKSQNISKLQRWENNKHSQVSMKASLYHLMPVVRKVRLCDERDRAQYYKALFFGFSAGLVGFAEKKLKNSEK